jgi:hypothetical protein
MEQALDIARASLVMTDFAQQAQQVDKDNELRWVPKKKGGNVSEAPRLSHFRRQSVGGDDGKDDDDTGNDYTDSGVERRGREEEEDEIILLREENARLRAMVFSLTQQQSAGESIKPPPMGAAMPFMNLLSALETKRTVKDAIQKMRDPTGTSNGPRGRRSTLGVQTLRTLSSGRSSISNKSSTGMLPRRSFSRPIDQPRGSFSRGLVAPRDQARGSLTLKIPPSSVSRLLNATYGSNSNAKPSSRAPGDKDNSGGLSSRKQSPEKADS